MFTNIIAKQSIDQFQPGKSVKDIVQELTTEEMDWVVGGSEGVSVDFGRPGGGSGGGSGSGSGGGTGG